MLTGAAYFAEKHMHRLEAVRAAFGAQPAGLISIFFVMLGAGLGTLTVRTPFAMLASILAGSIPEGS